MKACWHEMPEKRPSFTDLRNTMNGMREEEEVHLSFQFLSFSYEAIYSFSSPVVITRIRDHISSIYSFIEKKKAIILVSLTK